MSEFLNVTMDLGTSGWKVIYPKGQSISKFFLPSLVARGPVRETVNGIFEADYSTKSIDNLRVETPLGERLVGNLAKRSQTPSWAAYNKSRYGQPDFMEPMTLASLAETGLDSRTVVLTTAIPAEWYGQTIYTDGQDMPITEIITQHFQQTHVISQVGKRTQKEVNITNVNILTETKGLLYSFLIGKDGLPTVDDMTGLRVAVADIGELTTCLDMFVELEREKDSETLTDVSMGKIHQNVSDRIKSETGREIDLWQIRDLVRGGGYILLPHTGRGQPAKFDIMPIYQDEIIAAQRLLLSHLTQFLTNPDDVHYILVGGGGSKSLGKVISDNFRQAKILGRFATAQGLHNYGGIVCREVNR